MNKKDLIQAVSSKCKFSQEETTVVLQTILDVVSATIMKEENVMILGFGNFTVHNRKERKGFNPKTKEPLIIPAGKTVRFKVSKNISTNIRK